MIVRHVLRVAVVFLFLFVSLAGGPAKADNSHTAAQPVPVKMGTSGGSANDISKAFCCGGTLGSLVLFNGQLSILSNNHVLGRSGSAVTGEDAIQPGLIDNGCVASGATIVGDYAGNIVPLGTANVDAALSFARSGTVDNTGAILDIGVPCASPIDPAVGMSVTKSGRTTGQTFGVVQAVNVSVSITYQTGCNSGKKFRVSYRNQVSITPGAFSAGGDSGSLIVTDDANHQPAALLFAGSSSVTIGNPIADVVNAFSAKGSFSFVGGTCGPAIAEPFGATQRLQGPQAREIERVRLIKEENEADLFSFPAVLAVGVGSDESDPTQAVIVVYTRRGRAIMRNFPSQIDGVKIRIVPTDPFVAF